MSVFVYPCLSWKRDAHRRQIDASRHFVFCSHDFIKWCLLLTIPGPALLTCLQLVKCLETKHFQKTSPRCLTCLQLTMLVSREIIAVFSHSFLTILQPKASVWSMWPLTLRQESILKLKFRFEVFRMLNLMKIMEFVLSLETLVWLETASVWDRTERYAAGSFPKRILEYNCFPKAYKRLNLQTFQDDGFWMGSHLTTTSIQASQSGEEYKINKLKFVFSHFPKQCLQWWGSHGIQFRTCQILSCNIRERNGSCWWY